MSNWSVSPIDEKVQPGALATLVSAFMDDPVERWLYPELDGYLVHFPEFLAAFGDKAFSQGTVWSLGAFSDADHLPACLESPNPRNISFYERHGFVVTGEARAGTCPPVAFMLRQARESFRR